MDATGSTSTYEPILASSEEARQVIETETKSWEAESKEPAFLIAMRYAALHVALLCLAACMHMKAYPVLRHLLILAKGRPGTATFTAALYKPEYYPLQLVGHVGPICWFSVGG